MSVVARKIRLPKEFDAVIQEECEEAGVFLAHRIQSMRRVIVRHGLMSEVEREDAQVQAEADLRLHRGQVKGGRAGVR